MKISNNKLATFGGLLVAIANAWLTIDWTNFEFNPPNIMKLVISAMIFGGGYLSEFKKNGNTSKKNKES